MRRTIGAILIGAAALAMNAGAVVAQTQVSLPKIEESHLVVEAGSSVETPANTASIGFVVQSRAETLEAATSAQLTLLGAVTAAIEGAGVTADRISASSFETSRLSQENSDGIEVFLGFEAQCRVEARITEFELGPKVVDAAINAGATEVSRIEFDSTERQAARDQAITRAAEKARHDAQTLAEAAGVRLVRLRGVYLDPAWYDQQLGIPRGAMQHGDGRGGGGGASMFKSSDLIRRGARVVFEPEPVEVYATVRLVYETAPKD